MLKIDDVNALTAEQASLTFGNVVEKYPDIVQKAFSRTPFVSVAKMCEIFADELEKLPPSEKLKILQLHPILAGKEAERGELTDESKSEQKDAGLNTLADQEKRNFNSYNTEYLNKFNFPFVICARENKAQIMMEQIKIRLLNDQAVEINTGINEVKKICALRIMDLVKN